MLTDLTIFRFQILSLHSFVFNSEKCFFRTEMKLLFFPIMVHLAKFFFSRKYDSCLSTFQLFIYFIETLPLVISIQLAWRLNLFIFNWNKTDLFNTATAFVFIPISMVYSLRRNKLSSPWAKESSSTYIFEAEGLSSKLKIEIWIEGLRSNILWQGNVKWSVNFRSALAQCSF